MFLGSLLEDSNTTLPPCPVVQTASGGFHRYLLVPKAYPIHPNVSLWPGIDILAAGSSVVLPGSRTDAGVYRALRSFEECSIPEAPRAFVKLIRGPKRHGVVPVGRGRYFPRTWLRRILRRWRRASGGCFSGTPYSGHSGSAKERLATPPIRLMSIILLAKACFCYGLNYRQTESVILNWRCKHGLKRHLQ
jgi:Bifunctional DNA primase/polymerase, N-terminal